MSYDMKIDNDISGANYRIANGLTLQPAGANQQGYTENAAIMDESTQKANGIQECQTCKNRRYQDGSNDPGVSFKSPTKLSPGEAAGAVMSHEREHFSRENAKAEDEGREVLSNDIRIFTNVCTECGKTYVSGGETRTVTRKKEDQAQYAKKFFDENLGIHFPQNIDAKV